MKDLFRSKVVLMGASLGTSNRGVSALGASLVKLIDIVLPEADPVMLLGSRTADTYQIRTDGRIVSVPVINYRLSPKSKLRDHLLWICQLALAYRLIPLRSLRALIIGHCRWIKTVAEALLVGDIRGGDSFSDIYGLRRFLLSSLPMMTVIWIRGSIVLFPQTYGPFTHPLARLVARYILRHSSVILSRDQESIVAVEHLIGPVKHLRYCPDVAFVLDALRPSAPAIEPTLPEEGATIVVGLNVNGLMFNGGYTRRNMFGLKLDYHAFLRLLVTELLAQTSVHVLLVPHTFGAPDDVESDPQACREVVQMIPESKRGRIHLVTKEYDQHEIKGIINECDFFIGSRMHSCIAALSQDIPTVGVAYSRKFKGVFDSVGAKDWVVDGKEIEADDAVKTIMNLFKDRASMREHLIPKVQKVQQELRDTFALLHGENA